MRILLLDNYDSFTYMLRDYIEQCGAVCEVYRNDEHLPAQLDQIYHAWVISPGPGEPAQAGKTMQLLEEYGHRMPLLGVCLGHQAIGQYFGSTLLRANRPMHGKQSQVHLAQHPLFKEMPSVISVTRYHSLVLTSVPPELEVIAQTNEAEIMAIAHRVKPIFGLQFHPESCLSEYGLKIIQNFIALIH